MPSLLQLLQRRIAGSVIALILITSPLAGARRQQTTQTPGGDGQILRILVNKSVVINAQAPVIRILTGNPNVIETVATTPTQIVVTGKTPGTSSLIIWDAPDRSQLLDVVVEPDITSLRSMIERSYPDEQINVETDGTRIIISGRASTPRIAEDVGKIAALYSQQVVNSLAVQVQRERQVLLEVKFAEVDRTKIEQFGLNIISTGAANTIGTISTQQFGPASLQTLQAGGATTQTTFNLSDILNIFLFRPDINLAVTIKALEQQALLQILAEPNLLALNGQKASFLAGGEFPFPVVQGGQNVGAVTIQFRPFGVRLDFVGTIVNDVVRLQVIPEVSTLDFANAIAISGFVVPAISTRRAETMIELKDGQSFGIAGLIDQRAQTQLNKIPGIGDIPILGKLFRSRNINRSNTELIVIVTPRIVDPVSAPTPQPPPATPANPMPFLDSPSFDKNIPGNQNSPTPPPK